MSITVLFLMTVKLHKVTPRTFKYTDFNSSLVAKATHCAFLPVLVNGVIVKQTDSDSLYHEVARSILRASLSLCRVGAEFEKCSRPENIPYTDSQIWDRLVDVGQRLLRPESPQPDQALPTMTPARE